MQKKKTDIIEVALWFGIIVLINVIASQYFFRIDLTEDNRYSISDNSKDILKGLDDVVYVDVFLTGNLPGDYKRLEKSVREMLDEFRVYAGDKVKYKFIDPTSIDDEVQKNRLFEYLRTKGINPVGVQTKDGEKYIFPSANIIYKEKENPVVLLGAGTGSSEAEMVNQSIEGLEYEFISAIKALSLKNKKSIAFVEGHGEYDMYATWDLTNNLSQFYNTYRITFDKVKSLDNYDALIIAGPKTRYTEEEKYRLDQYIMKGGKVLFFIDPVNINMDSLQQNATVAVPYEHNLEDMLFRYGVRVNANLIQDLQAMPIPVVVGEIQGRPQVRNMPWRYYPVLNNFGEHAIVKNLDVVLTKFVGTIDTVKATGVNKTPLVYTSKYCKVFNAPLRVDLNDARKKADPEEFNLGPFPVAYLLEGNFTSLYKNRPIATTDTTFKEQGSGQLFVCSDADVIKNIQERKGQQVRQLPLPGGNIDLVINTIDYMLDERGLINVRAKEIALRPLDKIKVRDERMMWQIINLVLPVLLIIIFGIVRYYYRKKKYSQFSR